MSYSASITVASADEIKQLFLSYQAMDVPFHQTLKQEPWGATTFVVDVPAERDRPAIRRIDEYREVYADAYAEEPYSWGPEYADLFRRRFETQRQQEGFALVEARTTSVMTTPRPGRGRQS